MWPHPEQVMSQQIFMNLDLNGITLIMLQHYVGQELMWWPNMYGRAAS